MTVRQLKQLIRRGEGPDLEFKRAEIRPSDLAETFAALANTGGGTVLLGVNDFGTAVGVRSLVAARDLVEIAARECTDPPLAVPTTEVRLPRGGVVLAARVPKLPTRVASASGRVFVRRGSRNVPATSAEIRELLATRTDETEANFPYEILSHDLRLELHDASGERATLTRVARVRFLRDQVLALRDRIWGQGDPSPIVSVHPGLVVDRFRRDHELHSLISLREPKRRGEVATIEVVHRVERGFTRGHEWLEVEVDVPTRHLRVEIRFPRERGPRQAWLVEELGGAKRPLRGANVVRGADGAMLVWRRRAPLLRERFKTEWEW